MQITFENLLVITMSLGLVYYIISRSTHKNNIDNDLPAIDMTPLNQISQPNTYPVKPSVENVSNGNLREGFLFWRTPEAPVHKNLLTIHTTDNNETRTIGSLYD